MTYHIERDAEGMPVRMVWSPDEPMRPVSETQRCACGMEPPFHRRDCAEVGETGEA
jgi:hypothetical protein